MTSAAALPTGGSGRPSGAAAALALHGAGSARGYTHPDLPRDFRIRGGTAGMRRVAGPRVAVALAVGPPSRLPIGNPVSNVSAEQPSYRTYRS